MTPVTFRRRLRMAEKKLTAACGTLGSWIAECGKCELEPQWDREPMEALVRAVAHQQLHAKAAEAILGRLLALFPRKSFPTAKQLTKLDIPTYRSLGFSASKAEAILGIAQATLDGQVPDRPLAESMSDEELIQSLTGLRGIGRWTVEMILIFSLGRMDVMPCDDFGVRAGLMHLFELESMPKKRDFPEFTDRWAPYRSIGAWYLWRLADSRKSGKVGS